MVRSIRVILPIRTSKALSSRCCYILTTVRFTCMYACNLDRIDREAIANIDSDNKKGTGLYRALETHLQQYKFISSGFLCGVSGWRGVCGPSKASCDRYIDSVSWLCVSSFTSALLDFKKYFWIHHWLLSTAKMLYRFAMNINNFQWVQILLLLVAGPVGWHCLLLCPSSNKCDHARIQGPGDWEIKLNKQELLDFWPFLCV